MSPQWQEPVKKRRSSDILWHVERSRLDCGMLPVARRLASQHGIYTSATGLNFHELPH